MTERWLAVVLACDSVKETTTKKRRQKNSVKTMYSYEAMVNAVSEGCPCYVQRRCLVSKCWALLLMRGPDAVEVSLDPAGLMTSASKGRPVPQNTMIDHRAPMGAAILSSKDTRGG